jgi:uncharacterized surface protein with fasciclin (FAS1) repeats
MKQHRFILLAPIAALVAACASNPAATPVSVADTIAREPELSTLNTLVVKAGLTDTLKTQAPLTVFAPTNDAFKSVPAKTMDELAQDPAKLKAVLTYHVVPEKLTAADVKNADVKTAQGGKVALSKAGEFVTVEDAMVQHADIIATNGVVHTVDRVLMPPATR